MKKLVRVSRKLERVNFFNDQIWWLHTLSPVSKRMRLECVSKYCVPFQLSGKILTFRFFAKTIWHHHVWLATISFSLKIKPSKSSPTTLLLLSYYSSSILLPFSYHSPTILHEPVHQMIYTKDLIARRKIHRNFTAPSCSSSSSKTPSIHLWTLALMNRELHIIIWMTWAIITIVWLLTVRPTASSSFSLLIGLLPVLLFFWLNLPLSFAGSSSLERTACRMHSLIFSVSALRQFGGF